MPNRSRSPLAEERLLLTKFLIGDGCWEWQGPLNLGYGQFRWRGATRRAHRVTYELLVGPVPDGLELDHLCRNRACVRPDHLEPVTPSENVRRGLTPMLSAARMSDKTHCKYGHPYDEVNTYVTPSGSRNCRACRARQAREFRARHRPQGEE